MSPHRFVLPALLATAGVCVAETPTYTTFSLEARSNIVDGFNLPANSSFNSGTPDVNDDAVIAFRLIVVGGTGNSGIFTGSGGTGSVVYQAPSDRLTGDTSINNLGDVAFEQFDVASDGIFVYDASAMSTSVEVPPGPPFGATTFDAPVITDTGLIGFRASIGFAGQRFIADDGGVQTSYVAETALDPGSPYAFIFTPDTNAAGDIAGKVRIGGTGGSQPDEIRVFHADDTSDLIAVDDDGDPKSPYSGFDNSVALTDNGQVAFIASLVGGGRGVFISDGTTTTTIATTADPDVSDIEFFHPAANDNGVVAFRARNGSGLRAVFAGDGSCLRQVITEHDLLEIDLGTARVDQHDSSPTFGGSPNINAYGDVVFAATLTPENDNQVEWGTGMFVAFANPPGDTNGNGIVDAIDYLAVIAAWGMADPDADFNCDGTVDALDFLVLLANWS
jgi:hypothetical protein